MNPYLFALCLAVGGFVAAALYMLVLGFAGAPGALAGAAMQARSGRTPLWALFLTVAGQTYVSLAFAAAVIGTTRHHIGQATGLGKWLAWAVAFLVATSPAALAAKEGARTAPGNRTLQHHAATLTTPLTAVGFFVFVAAPAALILWAWVPHL